MSPQTETKASVGFKAGVKDYKLTYYTPDYETKDIDILAAFRVTPQPRVPLKKRGAAVGCRIFSWYMDNCVDSWTDQSLSLQRAMLPHRARCWGGKSIYCLCSLSFRPFEEGSLLTCLLPLWAMYLGLKPCELYVWKICEFQLLIPKLSKVRHMTSRWKEIN
ncbi:hypothetical protein HPP92_011137 [Vanilla planifolia]|uniref:Ribulose bisphosphate carboxylase large chain n=1 Tax=Vanilla planifolia TaxID=51239 RepID=A0A835V377_VANPL|nr:hypothetical protein HPP92_011137 [Vanilla planifolia]